MAKEIAFKIVADANQAASEAKTLKQQLREATKEAQNLIAAGKENTDAYRAARNEVAQLQDKLRDFNDELKALDPGNKFQTIAGLASGVAGGFQAAQGAMALFGAESKEVEKALLKVQAATALAQGIDQVRELGKYWDLAKLAILDGGKKLLAYIGVVEGATVAQNILNVATKAFTALTSPLGIAITALTVVVVAATKAYYDMIGAEEKAAESAKRLKKIKEDVYKSELEGQFKLKEKRAELLNDREQEIEKEKINYAKEVDAIKNANYSKKLEQNMLEAARLLHRENLANIDATYDAKETERLAKIKAEKDKALEEERKREEEYTKLRIERNRQENDNFNQQVANYQKIQSDLNNVQQEGMFKRTEMLEFDAEKQRQIRDKRIADEIAAEQALQAAKYQMATDSVNLISNVGNLVIKDQKKLEAFNKKAALIQIGIDTAKALGAALANANAPTVDNVASGGIAGIAKYIALAASITSSALRAKQILSGSGSSGSAPTLGGNISIPKAGGQTPSTNAPNVAGVTTIGSQRVGNQSGQGAGEGGQFKIYVTETDITSTQQRVGSIKQKAKVF